MGKIPRSLSSTKDSQRRPIGIGRCGTAIEKERQVRCFLYLTPSYELLSYVAGFFDRCAKAVYFGVLEDFRQHGLDAKVLDSRRTLSFPLRAVLNGNGA